MERMNREQFNAAMAGLDEARLRRALWTLYWRSAAAVRERIEAELAPPEAGTRPHAAAAKVDPDDVLQEVQEFIALARSGSYLAGDRRVSTEGRTRWRFTFRRLVADARQELRADDISPGVAASAGRRRSCCLGRRAVTLTTVLAGMVRPTGGMCVRPQRVGGVTARCRTPRGHDAAERAARADAGRSG